MDEEIKGKINGIEAKSFIIINKNAFSMQSKIPAIMGNRLIHIPINLNFPLTCLATNKIKLNMKEE